MNKFASSWKNVPTDADAGWRFWNWSKRFTGLIGEDQKGNLRIQSIAQNIFFTDIFLSYQGYISPMIKENKMDIRESAVDIRAGKL